MATIHTFVSQYFDWMIGISVILFLGSILLVPALVIRIPEDYFCHEKRQPVGVRHPLLRWLVSLIKNLLGAVLVVGGFIMLFTPGQGLLTLLMGLMIMNYPGKYALERWIINRLHLLPALNWLRVRYHIAPLKAPTTPTDNQNTSP